MTAEKFAVVSFFYYNQHASSCIKTVSKVGQSRDVCANKLYRKNLLENHSIRIRIIIHAMLELLTSCVTSISTLTT